MCGEPALVADQLKKMLAESGADELMIGTSIHDHEERKRSYDRVLAVLA